MSNEGMFAGLYLKFDPEFVFQIDELRNELGVIIRKMATKEQLDAVKAEIGTKLDLVDVKLTEEAAEVRSLKTSFETKFAQLDTPVDFSAELTRLDALAEGIENVLPDIAEAPSDTPPPPPPAEPEPVQPAVT